MAPIIEDPNIPDDEILYRRIPPNQVKLKNNELRPSSGAFRTEQMSVHLGSLVSPEDVLLSYPDQGLVSITAGNVRMEGCTIAREIGDPDPSHVLVCPNQDFEKKISKTAANNLSKRAIWIKRIQPPPNP